jgi:hypothetical protein
MCWTAEEEEEDEVVVVVVAVAAGAGTVGVAVDMDEPVAPAVTGLRESVASLFALLRALAVVVGGPTG